MQKLFNNKGIDKADNNPQFEFEGLHVSVTYNPSTNSVTPTVTESDTQIHHDELMFNKSLVGSFKVMSTEEQAKIAAAWARRELIRELKMGRLAQLKTLSLLTKIKGCNYAANKVECSNQN